MSLNFELSGIADFETVCFTTAEHDDPDRSIEKGDRVMTPVTNAIIWLTLGAGIGVIDDKTWQEFYARAALLEKIDGCFIRKYGEDGKTIIDRPLTPEDIYRHRGLRTNVSYETPAKWAKRIITDNKAPSLRYQADQWLMKAQREAA